MENLAEQPDGIKEQLAEREARFDSITQLSELLDGSMLTSFELDFHGHYLYGPDGRTLIGVAKNSEAVAAEIVRQNPALYFEPRRRKLETEEIQQAHAMARGEGPNTMVVVSDFPAELWNATKDVGGYNVRRKQTMLRVLTRLPNGNLQMYSQTLDGSHRPSLEAIYEYFGQKLQPGELLGQRIRAEISNDDQEQLIARLRDIYDQTMATHFGGTWYGGRQPADVRNTFDFVRRQIDLVNECVSLRQSGELTDSVMYNVAAAMQKRFTVHKQGIINLSVMFSHGDPGVLRHEMYIAGAEARQRGISFSACGGTLEAETFDLTTESLMEQAGYGNKDDEDKYGSLTFKCPKGHTNTRKRNKLLDACKHCGVSVKC